MIRMDIKYTNERSFLLDMKILLKTPVVVISQLQEILAKMKPSF